MALTKVKGPALDPSVHRKNFIFNGGFDLWQRGISFPNLSANSVNTYTADRWAYTQNTDGSMSLYQETSLLPTAEFTPLYSLKGAVGTVDTAIAAGQYSMITYLVEGYDYRKIKNRTVTLSFWIMVSKACTLHVAFRNNAADRSYIVELPMVNTDTWEKKTITLPLNQSGGTENYTNGTGLAICFVLAAGSNYHTASPNTWVSTNSLSKSNQTNFLNEAGSIYLSNVQLEVGSVATDFEYRPFAEELALCQRYYEKSYSQGTYPGAASTVGMSWIYCNGLPSATYSVGTNVQFKVSKRGAVSLILYSTTGASGKVRDIYATQDVVPTASGSESSFYWYATAYGAGTSYQLQTQWTADAEL